MILRAVAIAAALLAASGCYRATLSVQPASALIAKPDGTIAGTPTQVRVRPWPLRAARVTVEAPGYRSYPFAVRWRVGGALGRGRAIDVVLERELRRVEE
jgi:hypothetical protein